MVGIYVGATSGYSGKNMIAMGIGLKLQKEGYRVGYMKPVGALPLEKNGVLGDADAFSCRTFWGSPTIPPWSPPWWWIRISR